MPSESGRMKMSTSLGGGGKFEKCEWYHGMLPREDIARLLKQQGQFLVRVTEPKLGEGLKKVLSVFWDGKVRHYIIMEIPDGGVSIEKLKFGSIMDLVDFYINSKQPVSSKTGAKLLQAIPKQNWELHHEQIELGKVLGEGAFGAVQIGTLTVGDEKIKVAVKVSKCKAITKETIKDICNEARIMRQYSHPNIVRFYGVAIEKEPIMLVMELVNDGALDSYLNKHGSSLSTKQRIEMCFDAAKGLEYLHDRGCIHRDVAARNCLVMDGRVKISDFGLSRQLSKEGNYKLQNLKQKLPIRWLSPETLISAVYTAKSDVFSYGILMWEIFMDGAEPYPGMTVAEVNIQVKSGYRMEPPSSMPSSVSNIMSKHCFPGEPNDRWSMMQIRRAFEDLAGGNSSKKKRKQQDDTDKDKIAEKTSL